ncbi:MAG: HAD hydrolase-like protein [Acidobacteria bacterium]|nr:HAD hydrolase-like protein [Acidobacteriota bacterium]
MSTPDATAHSVRYTTQTAEPPHLVHMEPDFCWDEQNAYLFDIDGTLLRSRDRVHYDSFFASVREVMGHELNLSGVTLHGNTDPGILRDAFLQTTVDDSHWRASLEEVLDRMRTTVAAQRDQMQLVRMPAIEETLQYLAGKGATLGVATGNLEAIGWLKIETVGLRHWFRFGGFSDRYFDRADMIAHAAERARSIAGRDATVCVVGDTEFDIAAARANGLPTIAVATGNQSFDQLLQMRPEACTTSLRALLDATVGAQK